MTCYRLLAQANIIQNTYHFPRTATCFRQDTHICTSVHVYISTVFFLVPNILHRSIFTPPLSNFLPFICIYFHVLPFTSTFFHIASSFFHVHIFTTYFHVLERLLSTSTAFHTLKLPPVHFQLCPSVSTNCVHFHFLPYAPTYFHIAPGFDIVQVISGDLHEVH